MRKISCVFLTAIVLCGLIAVGGKAIGVNSYQPTVYEYQLENAVFADAGSTTSVQGFVFGDANGDGVADDEDLDLLQRHLNGWPVEIDTAAVEMNGDGKLNNKDLGLLQRYLNGWDVQPPTTKPTEPEQPSVVLPAEGDSLDKRIKLGKVTLSGQTVTMVIRNTSSAWEAEDGVLEYTCYDENNLPLLVSQIKFGSIWLKSEKTCTFDIPVGTVKVELTDIQVDYWSVPV